MMTTSTRFLLPFTEKIDMAALAYAVRFARRHRATLVPLALIPLSKRLWERGPRLEAIEQANDFMEVMRYQAARAGVKIDPCTLWTLDVMRSLRLFAREMVCAGILLFLRDGEPVLLSPEVVRRLLDEVPSTLLLVQLHPKGATGAVAHWLRRVFERILSQPAPRSETSLFPVPNVPGGTVIALVPVEMPALTRQEGKRGPRHARGTGPAC